MSEKAPHASEYDPYYWHKMMESYSQDLMLKIGKHLSNNEYDRLMAIVAHVANDYTKSLEAYNDKQTTCIL